jgi:hypothetical protein
MRHGIALSYFWSLDGLAQHRNINVLSHHAPHNREGTTNDRYPSDIWLEQKHSWQVRPESIGELYEYTTLIAQIMIYGEA